MLYGSSHRTCCRLELGSNLTFDPDCMHMHGYCRQAYAPLTMRAYVLKPTYYLHTNLRIYCAQGSYIVSMMKGARVQSMDTCVQSRKTGMVLGHCCVHRMNTPHLPGHWQRDLYAAVVGQPHLQGDCRILSISAGLYSCVTDL